MLTKADLDEFQYACVRAIETGTGSVRLSALTVDQLVKMARRYQAWRDAVLTLEDTPIGDYLTELMYADEIPSAEQFDAALDSAIKSQRKEGGEG